MNNRHVVFARVSTDDGMADSVAFTWLAEELERRTGLSRLEARGTLRLVLKSAGLDPSCVSAPQMDVVLVRLMPNALSKRRVDDAEELCRALATELRDSDLSASGAGGDTPYDVFERFGASAPGRRK